MNRSLCLLLIVVLAVFGAIVTHGTGHLLAGDWLSASYDSLGNSLLQGKTSVDPKAIQFERFSRNGESFMYFGPFPALLRIFLNTAFPAVYGKWARLSCLFAAILTVVPFTLATSRALCANTGLTARQRSRMTALSTLGFAFGSPLVYLVISSRIYNEAILWGLCGSVWGIYALSLLAIKPLKPLTGLWIFSLALGVTITSRVTFAVPMCLAAPVLFLWGMPIHDRFGEGMRTFLRPRLLPLLPALAGISFQLWYNHARFGSPFVFFDRTSFVPLVRHAGGFFNLQNIPSAAWNYLGFSFEYFSDRFPFFRLAQAGHFNSEFFVPDAREQCISLTFASSWLVFPAIWGMFKHLPKLFIAYAACLTAQVILILSFHFLTERYIADILPACILGLVAALQSARWTPKTMRLFTGSTVFSCLVMVSCALEWNFTYNLKAEPAYRVWFSGLLWPNSPELSGVTNRIALRSTPPAKEVLSPLPIERNKDFEALLQKERSGASAPDGHIFMRPGTRLTYNVPAGADLFTAVIDVSIAMASCDEASFRFMVRNAAGQTLLRSKVFRNRLSSDLVLLPLDSAKSIEISLDDEGDGAECDQGTWYFPTFATKATPPPAWSPAVSPTRHLP